MAKTNKEGWIRNRGKCPVEKGTLIDVKYRDGEVVEKVPALEDSKMGWDARDFFWRIDGSHGDIMQWRLSKQEESTVHKGEAVIPTEPSPILWRDQVRESKAKIAELEWSIENQKKMIAEFEAKLNAEGFALIDVVKQPKEDMSDPKNWRVGDLLEVIKTKDEYSNAPELDEGDVVEKTDSQSMHDDRISVIATNGRVQSLQPSCFKFHSRPTK